MYRPQVLIIGAMKCGTSSLAAALGAHAEFYLPTVKEPHFLCDGKADMRKLDILYQRLNRSAPADSRCIDASTGYAKLPYSALIPRRAKQYLGGDITIVYVMRDPVERVLSHYRHELRSGRLRGMSLRHALDKHSSLLMFSRYWQHLQSWGEHFGEDRFCLIQFEDLKVNFESNMRRILTIAGASNLELPLDALPEENRGSSMNVSRRYIPKKFTALTKSAFYKSMIKPVLPRWCFDVGNALLRTRSNDFGDSSSYSCVEFVREVLEEDMQRLWLDYGVDYRQSKNDVAL